MQLENHLTALVLTSLTVQTLTSLGVRCPMHVLQSCSFNHFSYCGPVFSQSLLQYPPCLAINVQMVALTAGHCVHCSYLQGWVP